MATSSPSQKGAGIVEDITEDDDTPDAAPEKFEKFVEAAAEAAKDRSHPAIAKVLLACSPVVKMVMEAVLFSVPYCVQAYNFGYDVYTKLHPDLLAVFFGLILCFFGGMYPNTVFV